ncbi:FHA domain-containing protein [Chloroflexota bacterium]
MITLVARAGPQAGMQFPVDRPSVRIGRGSGSEIVLQDTQISRQHAEISQQGDQFFIRDLGSTNGTFVNGQRVTQLHPLHPGDQVQVGDTVFACESVPFGAAAAGPVTTDWEASLMDDQDAAGGGRQRGLIYTLVAVAAVLLIAAAVVAYLVLKPSEPEPVSGIVPGAATSAIEVVPTYTLETGESGEGGGAAPTDDSLVDVPTVEVAVDVPTVKPKATKKPKAQDPVAPSGGVPAGVPAGPMQLEGLPAMVTQFLGDVPPDQLSGAISGQMGDLPPDQLQAMIGSLFPGVNPAQLPQVVAASFPDLPENEIQNLLGMAFPGQSIQIPQAGPVGGRLALSIYDEDEGLLHVYIANASGGEPTKVVEWAAEPDFSPDGQWLVYFSLDSERLGLRLIKTDGTEDSEVTTDKEHGYPSFSPDGNSIVFHAYDQNSIQVIRRCPDCGNFHEGDLREIAKGEYPAWSPVGDQVVYRGCVSGGQCGLVVANSDGSNPRQITTHANDAAPRWSPNGGQIVFHSDRDGNWEIYVINSDGSWLRRITMNPTTDIMPIWSPDGLRIAFRSDRGGQGAVYTTSGIGGAAFKLLDADILDVWWFNQMDWGR